MAKKEITIMDVAKSLDDLAIIFKEGFAMMKKHFDRIESHLDKMERNQKMILSKLDGNSRRHITN